MLGPLEPWNLGHKVGETWGKVKVGRGSNALVNTTVCLGTYQEPDGKDEGKYKDSVRLTKNCCELVSYPGPDACSGGQDEGEM